MEWILAAIGYAWALYEFRRAHILECQKIVLDEQLDAAHRGARAWKLRVRHLEKLFDR